MDFPFNCTIDRQLLMAYHVLLVNSGEMDGSAVHWALRRGFLFIAAADAAGLHAAVRGDDDALDCPVPFGIARNTLDRAARVGIFRDPRAAVVGAFVLVVPLGVVVAVAHLEAPCGVGAREEAKE